MNLFQASDISPDILTNTGSVDLTRDLTVGWQINGQSPLTAYMIEIYLNDSGSTLKYSTGKVTATAPVYGRSADGSVNYFYAEKIPASELKAAGIVNGYVSGYKLVITQYSGSESVRQTSPAVFFGYGEPAVAINPIQNPLTSRTAEFTATYTQAQGDPILWIRWVIAELSEGKEPIYDSGYIFGTAELKCSYDGFFTGNDYQIRCTVLTESGMSADSGWETFSVSYPLAETSGSVRAARLAWENCVTLEWSVIGYLIGRSSGTPTESNGTLYIPAGTSTIFGNERTRFMTPFSFAWRGRVPSAGEFKAASITLSDGGSVTITAETDGITVTRDGSTLFSQPLKRRDNDVYTVVVTPNEYGVRQETLAGGLYPDGDLFPEETLYPVPDTAAAFTFRGTSAGFTGGYASEVWLYGEQECGFFYIEGGALDPDAMTSLLNGERPSFGASTYFLTDFSEGVAARVEGSTGDIVEGASVYRYDVERDKLTLIAETAQGVTSLRDYAAVSGREYRYYVFQKGLKTYTAAPIVSNTVKPVFWDWAVLECEEDAAGAFHVTGEHIFSLNVASGSIGNNNSPAFYQGFTRYPLRQGVSANYASGQLEAYSGSVKNGVFDDSVDAIEALKGLSESLSPKFLKDRKGSIRRIETGGPVVSAVVDASPVQLTRVAFPWTETGEAGDAAVVTLPSDSLWPSDAITDAEFYIDPADGRLYFARPEPYTFGSEPSLSDGYLMIEDSMGFTAAELLLSSGGYLEMG